MFRKAHRYGGAVVLGLALTSSIALAQQSTNHNAFSLGIIADAIKYGEHIPWSVFATEDGKLVIKNSEKPGSWKLYGKKAAPTQNYTAQVEVISNIKADDEAITGAGIFFGAVTQADRTDFYALLLSEDSVTLAKYEKENWNRMLKTSRSSVNNSKKNTLAVSVKDDNFVVSVNGNEFASVRFANNQKTGLGVIVSGVGSSELSNYVVYDGKGEKLQTEAAAQLPTDRTTQPGPGIQRQVAIPPGPSGVQPPGQFPMPSQAGTQQPAKSASTLATADLQHYQAMQIRFTIATELCRAGDQDACNDATHRDELLQNAEGLFQRCQAGDQTSCQPYAQLRNQTYDIVARLQPLMTTPRAAITGPASGMQQGRTAIPPSASQWAAIDPELVKALYDRYAAAQKLCDGGTEGACTWLRINTDAPEKLAQYMTTKLQKYCVRTNSGWQPPPPRQPSRYDYGTAAVLSHSDRYLCDTAKANRDNVVADADKIVNHPSEIQWATEDEIWASRKRAHRQFQTMMEGQIAETKSWNNWMQTLRDIGGRTPMDYDIRAHRYDYCRGSGPCPAGVRERWGTATHPGAYGQ
jgi:hypothetical protein